VSRTDPVEPVDGEAPRSTENGISDADLADLVRHLADAVVICDRSGSITFWNPAAERIFGWSADEVLGTSLDLIIPERLRARHWEGYQRVMESGQTSYGGRLLEVPALHRDGRTLSIAFTVSLLRRSGSAGVTGIAALIRDDTERWQERRRVDQELEELRANAQDPIRRR
jgi:PAS domain S-box-containing protein